MRCRIRSPLIISAEVQRLEFAGANPIGETVYVNLSGAEFVPFTVAGVAAPLPDNSSIRFDYLIPENNYAVIFGQDALADWLPKSRTVTFFKTEPATDLDAVQSALDQIALQHGLDRFIGEATVEHLVGIERLADVHYSTLIENKVLAANGDPSYAFTLGTVALLVLLIACINFMNLSVGMSAGRSKEVGVRKVLGAKTKSTRPSVLVRIGDIECHGVGPRCRRHVPDVADVQPCCGQESRI